MNPEPPLLPHGIICLKWDRSCQSPLASLVFRDQRSLSFEKSQAGQSKGALQDLIVKLLSRERGCPFNQPFIFGASSTDPGHPLHDPVSPMGEEGHPLRSRLDLLVYCSVHSIVLFTSVDGNMGGKKRGREGLRKMKGERKRGM